jgi:transcription-repair coupling factor (superfamily II helicase)
MKLKSTKNKVEVYCIFDFIADQQSNFYQSNRFIKVVQFTNKNGNLCKMKEKETKNGLRLLLTFENVKSVNKALELLEGV